MQHGASDNKAPSYCSGFIATGSFTRDGKIVMGHNSWVEYIVGERWNVIADITPAKGNRIFMDSFPGYIHSGDDFVINGAGLVYTETTMSLYKGFKEDGTPEFARARKAAQYAASIDDFIRIMSDGNLVERLGELQQRLFACDRRSLGQRPLEQTLEQKLTHGRMLSKIVPRVGAVEGFVAERKVGDDVAFDGRLQ